MTIKSKNSKEKLLSSNEQHRLYETYYVDVFKTVYYFIKNKETSEDLVNDAYIKAFEQYGSLKEKDKFKPWICIIGLNLAKQYVRRNNRIYLTDTFSSFDSKIDSLEDELINKINQKEINFKLKSAISKLDIKYKHIIILRYYKKLSCKEIADQLDLNQNTIYTRLKRAKKKLQNTLSLENLFPK